MDSDLVVLRLILNEMSRQNVDASSENFAGRKNVQKLIYILMEQGVPIEYSYNWYLRGPYSPALASDFFLVDATLKEHYAIKASKFSLSDRVKNKIRDILSTLGGRESNLEAAASAMFLRREKRLNIDAAIAEMKKRKPDLVDIDGSAIKKLMERSSSLP